MKLDWGFEGCLGVCEVANKQRTEWFRLWRRALWGLWEKCEQTRELGKGKN